MSPKNITDHRIYGLDFLKYICCLFVIFIHMEFPSTVEVIILPLTRVAVPCFFMITGYFYEQTCKKDEGKKQIKKVIGFTLCANMLHLGWSFCKVALASESFAEYAKTLFSKENLRKKIKKNKKNKKKKKMKLQKILRIIIVEIKEFQQKSIFVIFK